MNSETMNFDNPIYGSEGEMMGKVNSTSIEEQSNGPEEQKDETKNVFDDFGQSLAKIWPLNALKTINSFLLLLLGIITFNGNKYEFSIGWSHFGEAIPHIYIDNHGSSWTRKMDLNSCFIVMFFISVISLILFFVLRKNVKANGKLLFGITIADFIVALISVPICINAFAIYGLMAAAEWKYFYPKLTNSSMTLVELTGWSVYNGRWVDYIPRPYATPSVTWYPHTYTHHPYQYQSHIGSTQRPWTGQTTPYTTPTPPPTTTMPILMEWQLRSMAERKRAIFVRIGLDSSATVISIILFIISICSKILLALLILLNLIFVFRLKKLMKNANLCQNDYRNFLFKNFDDEKIAKYSNSSLVGFFKFAHWFIPILVILLCTFYIPSTFQWICISFVSVFFFVNWIKFRNNSLKFPQKIARIDFIISFLAIIVYIIFISSIRYGRPLIMTFCQLSILLHIFHIIFILFLYFNEGKNVNGNNTLLDLKLPLISINLAINVIHQNKSDGGNGNEEKKLEEGPKEENINNGKEMGTKTVKIMMTV